MSDQFTLPQSRQKNLPGDDNTGKMLGIAAGTVGILALAWWLMGDASASDAESKPEPEPGPVGPDVGPLELYVSPDCKKVIVGSNWTKGWLFERVIEAVYKDNGGPILSNDTAVLNKSMNAVVRDLLAPWTDCTVKVPWADWYISDSPVPTPQAGQSRAQFYQLMDNHRDAFVAKLIPSLEEYKQLNTLIADISVLVEEVYLDRYAYDQDSLQAGGDDLGGSVGKLSPTQKARLRKMGYGIGDAVIELFQSDFNQVMSTWVGFDWYNDMHLEPTNEMDNATDDAIAFAFRSSNKVGVMWAGMVAQASGLGYDGQPPKAAPNS